MHWWGWRSSSRPQLAHGCMGACWHYLLLPGIATTPALPRSANTASSTRRFEQTIGQLEQIKPFFLLPPTLQEFLAAHPLSDERPQMSSWNGGVTRRQLGWLRGELAAAEAAGERVIVASHHQLGRGGARPTHMAWNYEEIQGVGCSPPTTTLTSQPAMGRGVAVYIWQTCRGGARAATRDGAQASNAQQHP